MRKTAHLPVIMLIVGFWGLLLWALSPVVMLVKAGLNATPDQELTHLEELYFDWDPAPRVVPPMCWMGHPVGGHTWPCPETSAAVTMATVYPRIKNTYVRSNPNNEVFLSWVSDFPSWITSGFGRRTSPLTGKKNTPHWAVDASCTLGEPVYATADGVVTASTFKGKNASGGSKGKGCGNLIAINHGYGMGADWDSLYCHFQTRMVKVGDRVEAGQQIGTCGSTGGSTGPHVHYALQKDGKVVDPLGYLPSGWEYTEQMKRKLGIR